LAAIELGNEVWSGKGETSITRYDIDLKTTLSSESSTVTLGGYFEPKSLSMRDEFCFAAVLDRRGLPRSVWSIVHLTLAQT